MTPKRASTSPAGTPWMWTPAYGGHEDRTTTHRYEATRHAVMQERAGLNSPFCSTSPRHCRSSTRWSQRAMIPSPLLRYALVAALAALAITWPGMVSARAQAQPRDGFSRTSPSGSYLAARHAGGQRDVAAAASYYRAALRGDPGNNELLGRTFVAVLANG